MCLCEIVHGIWIACLICKKRKKEAEKNHREFLIEIKFNIKRGGNF